MSAPPRRCSRALAPELFVFTLERGLAGHPRIRAHHDRRSSTATSTRASPAISTSLDEARWRARGVPAGPMLTKSNGGIMNAPSRQARLRQHAALRHGLGRHGRGLARRGRRGDRQRADARHRRHQRRPRADHRRRAAIRHRRGRRRLPALRADRRRSPRSAAAAARSPGSTTSACSRSGRKAPARRRARPATAAAAPAPTVTDAIAVCGFLGHAPTRLRRHRAPTAALARGGASATLASRLGRRCRQTAEAIIEVAVSEMFVEVNKLIARFGVDPRDFTLMPFGGAGPMLGCFLARELGIRRVMVPRAARRRQRARRAHRRREERLHPHRLRLGRRRRCRACATRSRQLQGRGASLAARRAGLRRRRPSRRLLGRHALSRPVLRDRGAARGRAWLARGELGAIAAAFHRAARGRSTTSTTEARRGPGRQPAPRHRRRDRAPGLAPAPAADDASARPERQVEVWLDGALRRRAALPPRRRCAHGHRFAGPGVVAQEDTTVCIPAGFAADRRRAAQPASRARRPEPWSTRSRLQVLANHCRAAAENMAYTLYRTAHSTFVKETEDFTVDADRPAGPHRRGADGSRRDLVSGHQLRPRHRPGRRLRAGRHRLHQRPLQRLSRDPRAGHSICGSRSSTRARSSASRAATSTTPTWAAPCRRACRAR